MTTRIKRLDEGFAVLIPNAVIAESGLNEDAEVDVTLENGAVVARPVTAKPRYKLDDLLRSVTADQLHPEISTGPSVGRECW